MFLQIKRCLSRWLFQRRILLLLLNRWLSTTIFTLSLHRKNRLNLPLLYSRFGVCCIQVQDLLAVILDHQPCVIWFLQNVNHVCQAFGMRRLPSMHQALIYFTWTSYTGPFLHQRTVDLPEMPHELLACMIHVDPTYTVWKDSIVPPSKSTAVLNFNCSSWDKDQIVVVPLLVHPKCLAVY